MEDANPESKQILLRNERRHGVSDEKTRNDSSLFPFVVTKTERMYLVKITSTIDRRVRSRSHRPDLEATCAGRQRGMALKPGKKSGYR